ncbi:Uncharacterised protein [Mycobacteroides abscessus subsp. abscessus]|nr:Uncharacterised protein [Mycobacteroides abscessus subsp. abscessus]
MHDASVTTPTGLPSSTTTTAPCARLCIRARASATECSGSIDTGVSAVSERLLT